MAQILTSMGGILEACAMVLAAAIVVGMEMRRCSHTLAIKRTLKKYMPETVGFVVLALIAGLLRIKGPSGEPLDDNAWNEIVSQWPWLMTADTLLGLQAMLRFLLFNSALLRLSNAGCSLAMGASVFFLLAISIRVGLFWYCPAYRLDGPLGGFVAAGFEHAAIVPLAALVFCSGKWNLKATFLTIAASAAAASAAWYHHFRLAEDTYADTAFICVHCLETLAAIAHLVQAGNVALASGGCIVALGLPAQQVLSAYYFLEAFEPMPALVGVGRPFEVMWGTGIAQLGIFLLSGAVYLACLTEAMIARSPDAVSTAVEQAADTPKLSTVVF
eukprot:gnl/MRDRNA2_/MRDRNA2_103331_c0_seq1.p1 gnl/MRDRNA2_/MRDRNA2_103331_c0~~gnl/MRDRNA2_/MRDRNA2_103331_c0_seq1.p1  ORF type:complete len:358 (-),score=58.55 gnl/MRDRNA2_/MRDRNA2_103331_c0_seq1:21-1010(-)